MENSPQNVREYTDYFNSVARRHTSAGIGYSYRPVSVCLSVTRQHGIETAVRMELILGIILASVDLSYTVF